MTPLSDNERAARHRLRKQIEKTAIKLDRLLARVDDDFHDTPSSIDGYLIGALEVVLGVPAQFFDTEDSVGFKFALSIDPELKEQLEQAAQAGGHDLISEIQNRSRVNNHQIKLNRSAFAREHLDAQLTNPRWGWVATKEPENANEKGSLYIFAWEHNQGRDGSGTVGLFHREVSTDSNGRRRPGHRDALEKIERVMSGELVPYIVWQKAVDPDAESKTIDFMNREYLSECDLYIARDGYWAAKIGNKVLIK